MPAVSFSSRAPTRRLQGNRSHPVPRRGSSSAQRERETGALLISLDEDEAPPPSKQIKKGIEDRTSISPKRAFIPAGLNTSHRSRRPDRRPQSSTRSRAAEDVFVEDGSGEGSAGGLSPFTVDLLLHGSTTSDNRLAVRGGGNVFSRRDDGRPVAEVLATAVGPVRSDLGRGEHGGAHVSGDDIFASMEEAVHHALRSGREELAEVPEGVERLGRPQHRRSVAPRSLREAQAQEASYAAAVLGLSSPPPEDELEAEGHHDDGNTNAPLPEVVRGRQVLRQLSDIRARLAGGKREGGGGGGGAGALPPSSSLASDVEVGTGGDGRRAAATALRDVPSIVEIVEAADAASRTGGGKRSRQVGSLKAPQRLAPARATRFDPASYATQLLHRCGPKPYPTGTVDNEDDASSEEEDGMSLPSSGSGGDSSELNGDPRELDDLVKDFTRRVMQDASLAPGPAVGPTASPVSVIAGVSPAEARRLLQTSSVSYNPALRHRASHAPHVPGQHRSPDHDNNKDSSTAPVGALRASTHRGREDASPPHAEAIAAAAQEALVKRVVEAIPALSPDLAAELARQRRALDHLTSVQQEHLRKLDRERQEESRRRLHAPRLDPASALLCEATQSAPEGVLRGLHRTVAPLMAAGQQLQRSAGDPTQPLPAFLSFTTPPPRALPLAATNEERQALERALLDREARFYEKELSRLRDDYGARLDDEKAKRRVERRVFQEVLQKQQHDMLQAHTEALRLVKRESQLAAEEHAALVRELTVRQEAARAHHGAQMQKRHEEATKTMLSSAIDVLTARAPSPRTLPERSTAAKKAATMNWAMSSPDGAAAQATRARSPTAARKPSPLLRSDGSGDGKRRRVSHSPRAADERLSETQVFAPASSDAADEAEPAGGRHGGQTVEEPEEGAICGVPEAHHEEDGEAVSQDVEGHEPRQQQQQQPHEPPASRRPRRDLAARSPTRDPARLKTSGTKSSTPPPRSPQPRVTSAEALRARYGATPQKAVAKDLSPSSSSAPPPPTQQPRTATGPAAASHTAASKGGRGRARGRGSGAASPQTPPAAAAAAGKSASTSLSLRRRRTVSTTAPAAERDSSAGTPRALPPPRFLSQTAMPLAAVHAGSRAAARRAEGHDETSEDEPLHGSQASVPPFPIAATTAGRSAVGRTLVLLSPPHPTKQAHFGQRDSSDGGGRRTAFDTPPPPPPPLGEPPRRTFEESVDAAYAQPAAPLRQPALEEAPHPVGEEKEKDAAGQGVARASAAEEEGTRPVARLAHADYFYFGESLSGDYARRWHAYEQAERAVKQLELAAAPDPGPLYEGHHRDGEVGNGSGREPPPPPLRISTQGEREGFSKEWARDADYLREVLQPKRSAGGTAAAAAATTTAGSALVVTPAVAHKAKALLEARQRLARMRELLIRSSPSPFHSFTAEAASGAVAGRRGCRGSATVDAAAGVPAGHANVNDGLDIRERIEREVIHSVLGEAAEEAVLRGLLRDLERELLADALRSEVEGVHASSRSRDSNAQAVHSAPTKAAQSEQPCEGLTEMEELWRVSLEDAILEKLLHDPAWLSSPEKKGGPPPPSRGQQRQGPAHGDAALVANAIARAIAPGGLSRETAAKASAGEGDAADMEGGGTASPRHDASVTEGEHVTVSVPTAPDPEWVSSPAAAAPAPPPPPSVESDGALTLGAKGSGPRQLDVAAPSPARTAAAAARVGTHAEQHLAEVGVTVADTSKPVPASGDSNASASSAHGGTVKVVLDVAPLWAEFQKQARASALAQQTPRHMHEEPPRARVAEEDLRDVIVESVTVLRRPTSPPPRAESLSKAAAPAKDVVVDSAPPLTPPLTRATSQQPNDGPSSPASSSSPPLHAVHTQHVASLVRWLTDAEADRRCLIEEREEGQRETLAMMQDWARRHVAPRQTTREVQVEAPFSAEKEPEGDTRDAHDAPPSPPPFSPAKASNHSPATQDARPPIRDPVTRFIFEWLKDYGDKEEAKKLQREHQQQGVELVDQLNAAAATAAALPPASSLQPQQGRDADTSTSVSSSAVSADASDSWLSSTHPSSYAPEGNHRFLRGPEALHISSRRPLRPEELPSSRTAATEEAWAREAARHQQHQHCAADARRVGSIPRSTSPLLGTTGEKRPRRPILDATSSTVTSATALSASSVATTRYTAIHGGTGHGHRAAAREGVDGLFRPHEALALSATRRAPQRQGGANPPQRPTASTTSTTSRSGATTRHTLASLTTSTGSSATSRQRRDGEGRSRHEGVGSAPPRVHLNDSATGRRDDPAHQRPAADAWPHIADAEALAEQVRLAQEAARARQVHAAATSAFDGAALQHSLSPSVPALSLNHFAASLAAAAPLSAASARGPPPQPQRQSWW